MKVEPIGISNPGFFIANVLKDCPAKTVIRELLQNAIEASGTNLIEWFREDWNGVPKLGLYNEGVGMDRYELRERMEIASSGKELGHSKNFGQGAKMSAGKASPHGLLYRSCKDGIVSEIWIQLQSQPDGGQLLVIVPQWDVYNEEMALVRQVTDEAADRGRHLDREWTEALLLGRSSEDDTVSGDFLGQTSVLWLAQLINQRYYRFPPGVRVHKTTITTNRSQDEHRVTGGLASALQHEAITERSESVSVEHPFFGAVAITYGKMTARTRRRSPLTARGLPGSASHVCLVWKNELYDMDMRWYNASGAYGFPGASEDYYLHIHLSDDARIRNNNHRSEIVCDTPGSEQVLCEQFCNLIRDNRPQWVIDDLKSRQESQTSGRLRDRFRKLAERLKARLATPVVLGDGTDPGVLETDRGDGQGGDSDKPTSPDPRENGRETRRGRGKPQSRVRMEDITAEFRHADQEDWHQIHQDKAGAYEEAVNIIYLNRQFPGYQRLKAWIDQTWSTSDENGQALVVLDEEYCYHAGAFGMAAISFRGVPSWSPDQWKKSLTPESLSAFLTDPLETIRIAVHNRLSKIFKSGYRERAEELIYAD